MLLFPQPTPALHPCGKAAPLGTHRHTHARADGGQQLPSLSVDFEIESAILNRARVPTHIQWNGRMKCYCKAPPSPAHSPFSAPPALFLDQGLSTLWRQHEHSSLTASKQHPAGLWTETISYIGKTCVRHQTPGVL